MDESDSLHIIGEEENGDEFYEKIEAPKFVDLTAPDPYHPGDDRYWFCSRFGELNISSFRLKLRYALFGLLNIVKEECML